MRKSDRRSSAARAVVLDDGTFTPTDADLTLAFAAECLDDD
jgi:hypothetical protein